MGRYLIRRLLWAVVLFFAVTVVSYVLFYLIPANPAKAACGQACTEAEVARVAHFLGTDRPIYVQYGKFVGRLMPVSFTGGPHFKTPSLGNSFYNRQPVNTLVLQAAPVTMSLVFGGVFLWLTDRDTDRHPLGPATAFAVGPSVDDVRPDRDLDAPDLDRADLRLRLRLQAPHHADHGVCRRHQPAARRAAAARSSGPTT